LIVERDPGLRRQIWEYPGNKRDQVREGFWSSKYILLLVQQIIHAGLCMVHLNFTWTQIMPLVQQIIQAGFDLTGSMLFLG